MSFAELFSPVLLSLVAWAFVLGTPVAALLALAALRDRRARLLHSPLFWVPAGAGPFLGLLWLLFNTIENWLGLDSFMALAANLVLFVLIGALVGLSAGRHVALRHVRHLTKTRATESLGDVSTPPESETQRIASSGEKAHAGNADRPRAGI